MRRILFLVFLLFIKISPRRQRSQVHSISLQKQLKHPTLTQVQVKDSKAVYNSLFIPNNYTESKPYYQIPGWQIFAAQRIKGVIITHTSEQPQGWFHQGTILLLKFTEWVIYQQSIIIPSKGNFILEAQMKGNNIVDKMLFSVSICGIHFINVMHASRLIFPAFKKIGEAIGLGRKRECLLQLIEHPVKHPKGQQIQVLITRIKLIQITAGSNIHPSLQQQTNKINKQKISGQTTAILQKNRFIDNSKVKSQPRTKARKRIKGSVKATGQSIRKMKKSFSKTSKKIKKQFSFQRRQSKLFTKQPTFKQKTNSVMRSIRSSFTKRQKPAKNNEQIQKQYKSKKTFRSKTKKMMKTFKKTFSINKKYQTKQKGLFNVQKQPLTKFDIKNQEQTSKNSHSILKTTNNYITESVESKSKVTKKKKLRIKKKMKRFKKKIKKHMNPAQIFANVNS